MRFHVASTALGLALVAAAPAANAQAVITREIVQPVQTVQTTETITHGAAGAMEGAAPNRDDADDHAARRAGADCSRSYRHDCAAAAL